MVAACCIAIFCSSCVWVTTDVASHRCPTPANIRDLVIAGEQIVVYLKRTEGSHRDCDSSAEGYEFSSRMRKKHVRVTAVEDGYLVTRNGDAIQFDDIAAIDVFPADGVEGIPVYVI
jgi:hypothetical protein